MVGGKYEARNFSGLEVFKGTVYGPAKYLFQRGKRFRRMTQDELDRYDRKVTQSKGFDVDGCTGSMPGRISIIPPTSTRWKAANIVARFAAFEHGGKRLEVLSLDKANLQPVEGTMYYVTFTAIDTVDQEIKTYRAKVLFRFLSQELRLMYFKEFKTPKKAVTAHKKRGSMSGSKISKAKKAKVLQVHHRLVRAGGVLPAYTPLLQRVKSNPSMTHAMARDVASKKWKSLSNVEKQSFIYEAGRKSKS